MGLVSNSLRCMNGLAGFHQVRFLCVSAKNKTETETSTQMRNKTSETETNQSIDKSQENNRLSDLDMVKDCEVGGLKLMDDNSTKNSASKQISNGAGPVEKIIQSVGHIPDRTQDKYPDVLRQKFREIFESETTQTTPQPKHHTNDPKEDA